MTLKKRIYNYRLSRARRTVENVFGILTSQWRLLRRPILVTVSTKMTQAIICLHNWLRKHDVERETYVTQEFADQLLTDGNNENEFLRQIVRDGAFMNIKRTSARAYSLRAAYIREEFCRFFNEEESLLAKYSNLQINVVICHSVLHVLYMKINIYFLFVCNKTYSLSFHVTFAIFSFFNV